jgi:hypothetical protein
MKKKGQAALDAIVDVVLAYKRKAKPKKKRRKARKRKAS